MRKPPLRLWLVGGMFILAGVVGRVVLDAAAPGGDGYISMTFQAGFYAVGLIVMGFWVLSDARKTPTGRAVAVWLAAAVLCAILTCASSPK